MSTAGRVEAMPTVPAGMSVSASNGSGGPNTCALGAGLMAITDLFGTGGGLLAALQTALNTNRPAGWTVSIDVSAGGTGKVTIRGTGNWSIDFANAGDLCSLLGFSGSPVSASGGAAVTAPNACHGVWLPDCSLFMQTRPNAAPIASDLRSTVSPRAKVISLKGNKFYRHKIARWSNVSLNKAWASSEVVPGESFETFLRDTQLGESGWAWFGLSTPIQIVNHAGTIVGIDANGGSGLANGWQIPDLANVDEIMTRDDAEGWEGFWRVELPQLLSSG